MGSGTSTDAAPRAPPDPAEAFVGNAVTRLTVPQRATYLANLPKIDRVRQQGFTLRTQVIAPLTIGVGKHPQIRTVPDPKQVARKNAQVEALRKAYGGVIPGGR
jgi:hypothetical protein